MKTENSEKISKQFRFYIPKRLPGLNEIIKWSKQPVPWLSKGKRRVYQYTIEKREIENYIIAHIYKQSNNNIPNFTICQIYFKWIESNRRRDPSNVCAGGRKFILDALVKSGVLKNDNWLVAEFKDEFIVDKKQAGVEITILNNSARPPNRGKGRGLGAKGAR
jgi:Holliday junction resolvase RusA-like endonuclease